MTLQVSEQRRTPPWLQHARSSWNECQRPIPHTAHTSHRPYLTPPCLALLVAQVVAPGDMLTVPGEGFVGGDLVIYFDIQFPKTLTPAQKKSIKAVAM